MFVLRCREERIAQLSFFFLRRSFFAPPQKFGPERFRGRCRKNARMRWSGRIFWLLACGSAFAERPSFPPSPPNAFGDWPWEVVSSYSSATAPGLHGISRADPLLKGRKELDRELLPCLRALKTNLLSRAIIAAVTASNSSPSFLVTGGAGFIGSNLTLALQQKFPDARLTVIDDFRSGDFKNLRGYRGDFVAQNLATLDWREQFSDEKFDAIFHLASITDTTLHDQFVQVHDNVESFRRLLEFARPNKTRIVYASSASTYGPATATSVESNGAAPANVYAFSKTIMDRSLLGCVTSMFTVRVRRTKACRPA